MVVYYLSQDESEKKKWNNTEKKEKKTGCDMRGIEENILQEKESNRQNTVVE